MLRDIKYNYQNYILILLIISGPIKGLFNKFIFNIDITLIAFVLAGVDFLFQIAKHATLRKKAIEYSFLLLILFLLIIVSFLYSSSSAYAKTKTITFAPVLLSFAYPMVMREFNWKLFIKAIYYIVIPLSLWFVYYRYFYWSPENSKGRVLDDSFYDLLGSYLGLGFILSLSVFILIKRKQYLISVLILLLIIALGARGPFIFCILTLLIVYFKTIIKKVVQFKTSTSKLKRLLIFILGFALIFIYKFKFISEKLYLYGFDRFLALFLSEKTDVSANKRIEVMGFAIENIFTNPFTVLFGNGIGSFGIDYSGEDVKLNPHNIFLEAWYELGILGFLIISFFLLTPFYLKRNTIYLCFILFSFLDCLKSNNLSGIWILAILYSIHINDLKIKPNIK